MSSELEKKFRDAMIEIYERGLKECKYNASRFIQMVSEIGALATAKAFLASQKPFEGFIKLYKLGRLDLSVERVVAYRDEFKELFTQQERDEARRRLDELGYKDR